MGTLVLSKTNKVTHVNINDLGFEVRKPCIVLDFWVPHVCEGQRCWEHKLVSSFSFFFCDSSWPPLKQQVLPHEVCMCLVCAFSILWIWQAGPFEAFEGSKNNPCCAECDPHLYSGSFQRGSLRSFLPRTSITLVMPVWSSAFIAAPVDVVKHLQKHPKEGFLVAHCLIWQGRVQQELETADGVAATARRQRVPNVCDQLAFI